MAPANHSTSPARQRVICRSLPPTEALSATPVARSVVLEVRIGVCLACVGLSILTRATDGVVSGYDASRRRPEGGRR